MEFRLITKIRTDYKYYRLVIMGILIGILFQAKERVALAELLSPRALQRIREGLSGTAGHVSSGGAPSTFRHRQESKREGCQR